MKSPHRASSRVRGRLKDELRARGITQRDLAKALSKLTGERWTQSKVGKVLNANVQLLVDDAESIATVAGIFMSEAVRDRGLEFYAEMTPTEMRVLDELRRRPDHMRAVMMLMDIPASTELKAAKQKRAKRGRPMLSEIRQREENAQ